MSERRRNLDRTVLRALRAPRIVDPPQEWVDQGLDRLSSEGSSPDSATSSLARRARRIGSAAGDALRRIHGKLVLDTFAGAALQGVRGAATGGRQMLILYPKAKLYLRITQAPNGLAMITGQYVTADRLPPRGSVTLQTADGVRDGDLESTGEFRFERVPRGEVSVTLRDGSDVLVSDPIRI